MNISVIGSGYVGLITGVGFAKLGHKVVCVDIVKEKVDAINEARPPPKECPVKVNEVASGLAALTSRG